MDIPLNHQGSVRAVLSCSALVLCPRAVLSCSALVPCSRALLPYPAPVPCAVLCSALLCSGALLSCFALMLCSRAARWSLTLSPGGMVTSVGLQARRLMSGTTGAGRRPWRCLNTVMTALFVLFLCLFLSVRCALAGRAPPPSPGAGEKHHGISLTPKILLFCKN
jgi:hypothetical protein